MTIPLAWGLLIYTFYSLRGFYLKSQPRRYFEWVGGWFYPRFKFFKRCIKTVHRGISLAGVSDVLHKAAEPRQPSVAR